MPQNILSQWLNYFKNHRYQKNADIIYQESRDNIANVHGYPTRCFIEITDKCNLKCKFCGHSFIKVKRTNIPDSVIEKIRPLFPYMSEVWVVGFGESLIDPRFFDILAMIPKRIMTRYVSNGLLMNREAARKMVDLRLMDLCISIDAIDEASYFQTRGVNGFNKIIENIKVLNEIKQQKGSKYPELRLSYTFFRSNAEKFLDFIDLAHSLGAVCVSADYLTVYREDLIHESLFWDQELGNRVFKAAQEKCDKLGMILSLPPSFEEAARTEKPGDQPVCYEPWNFVRFRSNGQLSPCCVNDIQLGNLEEKSFDEIWNGKDYQEFRKQVNTSRYDLNCKQCIGWGIRKISDIRYHIKILDTEGKVVTHPEIHFDPARYQDLSLFNSRKTEPVLQANDLSQK